MVGPRFGWSVGMKFSRWYREEDRQMGALIRAARFVLLLTSVSLSAGLAGCGHEVARAARPRAVRVGIQPVYSLAIMSQRYRPLIEYLSEETGYRVEQISSLSQTSYLSALEGSRADVAFLNPLLYLQVAKTKGAYPLVRVVNPDGTDHYRGVIITRADSGITSLQDLRGCIAMTSSKKGVAGYLGQYKVLWENGIDPDRDLTVVVGRTQDDVARAVFRGKVKAGFVREDFIAAVGPGIDPGKLRVIAYTDFFPGWCFAAFQDTDPVVAEAVKQALLSLDVENAGHRSILEQAEAAGFIEASDRDYDSVREILADVGLPY
jgi:phosphonate transport system substrate-binding protein